MKKTVLSLSLSFFIYTGIKAQILDTLTLKDFKALRHKQIKALYSGDKNALDLIKKNQTRKINSYIFFGLSVPFAVTLDQAFFFPFTIAIVKNSNNTKKSLYNKLLYYERAKYQKDTLKMSIPSDTNSYKYQYAHHVFNMTLAEFKALGYNKQHKLLIINDTTQYIFDYYDKYQTSNYAAPVVSSIFWGGGALFYAYGAANYFWRTDGYQVLVPLCLVAGTISSLIGFYTIPTDKEIRKFDVEGQTYNSLQLYYLTHNVHSDMARYIKNRREQYKPKPLFDD